MNPIRKLRIARYKRILLKELGAEINTPGDGLVFLTREQSRMLNYIGCPTMNYNEGKMCGWGDNAMSEYLNEKAVNADNALKKLIKDSRIFSRGLK